MTEDHGMPGIDPSGMSADLDDIRLVLEALPGAEAVPEVEVEDLRALAGWVDTWNAAAGVTRPEEDVAP